MKAILLGLLILGQALTSTPSPTRQDIRAVAITRDIGGDHPLECFLALKESHEASRAAWAPPFDPDAANKRLQWESDERTRISDGSWWQDVCGTGESPEWYECMAARKRVAQAEAKVTADRVLKARAALGKVDQVCGWGKP